MHNSCKFTKDQQALQQIINEATRGGRKALSVADAETILDWAKELKYPEARALLSDVTGQHGSPAYPHIHIPGSAKKKHIPVEPGARPRTFPQLDLD